MGNYKTIMQEYEDNPKLDTLLRPLGDITNDLEPLILEMVEQHDMQWGEILNLIYGYLSIHCPQSQEVYEDDTNPIFYYGAKNET